MTVKPIAAGTPQRIISKINEIINALNAGGGSGGSGTADAILDAATVADAGKALGIDAEGEPALIEVGGGTPLLRCNLTYTGTGDVSDPYVGHLDHASDIVNALDTESSYDPIIVVAYSFSGENNQTLPAVVQSITEPGEGAEPFTYSVLACYSDPTRANVSNALMIDSAVVGGVRSFHISDEIASISYASASIVDNVLVYSA